jgi:hypothetical protein
MADGRLLSYNRLTSATLIFAHIIVCCVSLVDCANLRIPGSSFKPELSHLFFDSAQLYDAVVVVGAFALVSIPFQFARFSFGYFVGFYLYTMVLGYLWLNCFSDLRYDHHLGGVSAAASAIAFLFPALFISSPIRQVYTLSPRAFEHLLRFILLLSMATIAVGATYNFRLVALENIYDYRDKLSFPTIVNYLVGITSSALLPFAFACFVSRNNRLQAAATLIILLLFYPITLSKITLFTPLWLVFMALVSKIFEARISVVLSLLIPLLAGVVLFTFFEVPAEKYISIVNYRMSAIPSVAMDVYSDFFSKNDFTYFCQISVLKPLIHCPYEEPLSIVMKNAYQLGNFNASLFATEGIASVGLLHAPIIVFVCGLIIGMANRLSAGLPPSFILISGAVLPQILMNVPLTIVLLTHGLGVLFLMWYIMPRTMFEAKPNR